MVLMVQEYNKLLLELSDLQRADVKRRRQALEQLPVRIIIIVIIIIIIIIIIIVLPWAIEASFPRPSFPLSLLLSFYYLFPFFTFLFWEPSP